MHRWQSTALAVLALIALLTACSSGEQIPAGTMKLEGNVVLPAGHGVDLASLRVATAFGEYPVASDGKFSALVHKDGDSEVGVETAGGDLLLLGVTGGASTDLTLRSTAEALLYYLVGGMWLPADEQGTVRSLLRGRPESTVLAEHLQRLLLAGGNGLADPDEAFMDDMTAANASLLPVDALRESGSAFGICPDLAPMQAGTLSVIIHDGTTQRAGAMILHNEGGLGILAMNELRRPSALLAYEVSWRDVDQVHTDVDPPLQIARVEVPATGNLEFFAALGDIITGDAPWAPVFSPGMVLPGHDGASITQYELVLIGPSFSGERPPIWYDSRFSSLRDEWEDIALEKSVQLVLEEMLIPLLEVYALGKVAKFDAAALRSAREKVKTIYDNHLLQLGVYLRTDPLGGYAAGLKFVLEEMAVNKTLRTDMINMVVDALGMSERSKLSVEVIDAKLATRAAASAIAFAVQTVLVGSDVTKIMKDLATNPMVASWQAEAMPARFLIDPPSATIRPEYAAQKFTLRAIGDPPVGNYRFRWTTSGKHGVISDLLQDGVVLDTTAYEIWYFHNDPVVLNERHVDTVLLEVFLVDPGVTEIPPDATPIGKAQAVVRGAPDEMCVITCDDDGICYIYCP
ncbi:MAG: hypothetical protein KF813_00855 [Trueperaceae bacterium]|nr:hypothetical protein [Trueperaceae bacterium]